MATITTDSLPTDVSAYIQAELRTGKYQSAEELVTTALRERRDREQANRRACAQKSMRGSTTSKRAMWLKYGMKKNTAHFSSQSSSVAGML